MKSIFRPKDANNKGQIALPQILSLIILLFIVFTVGRILFNASVLDPDASDGGNAANGQASLTVATNSLTNIGFIVMSGIILIAAMASVAIRFF